MKKSGKKWLWIGASTLALAVLLQMAVSLNPLQTKNSASEQISMEGNSTRIAMDSSSYSSGGISSYARDVETKNAQNYSDESFAPETTGTTGSVKDSRKIIRNASLSIESRNFDKSVELLKQDIEKIGGYIENSYMNATSPRSSSYTIRIPVDQFDIFLEGAGSIGTIVSSSTSDNEITDQYYDTEARLKSLKTQQERLLAILEKAETLTDVIALESELSNVLYQIESLTGTLRKYDQLISYSTATIYLREVMEESVIYGVPASLGERIAQTFSNSVKQVKTLFEGFIVAVVGGLPIMLLYVLDAFLIIIVAFSIIRIAKKMYREHLEKDLDTEEKSEEHDQNDDDKIE